MSVRLCICFIMSLENNSIFLNIFMLLFVTGCTINQSTLLQDIYEILPLCTVQDKSHISLNAYKPSCKKVKVKRRYLGHLLWMCTLFVLFNKGKEFQRKLAEEMTEKLKSMSVSAQESGALLC